MKDEFVISNFNCHKVGANQSKVTLFLLKCGLIYNYASSHNFAWFLKSTNVIQNLISHLHIVANAMFHSSNMDGYRLGRKVLHRLPS
jgi:hypothetical protein